MYHGGTGSKDVRTSTLTLRVIRKTRLGLRPSLKRTRQRQNGSCLKRTLMTSRAGLDRSIPGKGFLVLRLCRRCIQAWWLAVFSTTRRSRGPTSGTS